MHRWMGWRGGFPFLKSKSLTIIERVFRCYYRSSEETSIDQDQNLQILKDPIQACDSRSSRKKAQVNSGVPTLVVPSLAAGKSLDTGTLLLILLAVSKGEG